MEPIVKAVFNNKTSELTRLLDEGVSPDTIDDQRTSLLATAIFRGHMHCFEILLQRGANPSTLDALLQASRAEELSFLKMLLNAGADPNRRHYSSYAPIIHAIERDNLEAVQLLRAHGAGLSENACGTNPLASAAKGMGTEVLSYLLDELTVEVGSHEAQDAVRQATIVGNIAALEKLLPLIDMTAQSPSAQQPRFLWFAVVNRQLESAKLLLESGANPNTPDEDGNTPLWHAEHRKSTAMVELLIEFGADHNLKSTYARLPDEAKAASTEKVARLSEILDIPYDLLKKHLIQPLPEPAPIPRELETQLPEHYRQILETTSRFRLFSYRHWHAFELWGVVGSEDTPAICMLPSVSAETDQQPTGLVPIYGQPPDITVVRLADEAIIAIDYEVYEEGSSGRFIANNLREYVQTIIELWEKYDEQCDEENENPSEWWGSYASYGERYDLSESG